MFKKHASDDHTKIHPYLLSISGFLNIQDSQTSVRWHVLFSTELTGCKTYARTQGRLKCFETADSGKKSITLLPGFDTFGKSLPRPKYYLFCSIELSRSQSRRDTRYTYTKTSPSSSQMSLSTKKPTQLTTIN